MRTHVGGKTLLATLGAVAAVTMGVVGVASAGATGTANAAKMQMGETATQTSVAPSTLVTPVAHPVLKAQRPQGY